MTNGPLIQEEFHKRLVNNENSFYDVTFNFVDDEKTSIYAHHAILKVRAPQLLEGSTVKRRKGTVIILGKKGKPIPNHANSLIHILHFLYSGSVNKSSYDCFQALDVMNIAESYNLTYLYQFNLNYITQQLNIDTIYKILSYAHDIGVKEAKNLCIEWALRNTDFFTHKGASELRLSLFQEVLGVLVQQYNEGKKQPTDKLEAKDIGTDPIMDNFKSLYNSKETTGDVSFTIKSKIVKAHKCVLSGLCEQFDQLLSEDNSTISLPEKYTNLSPESFQAALRYFYYANEALELLYICQLWTFANEFKLNSLITVLQNGLSRATVDILSTPLLLDIVYTKLDEDKNLQKKAKNKLLAFVVQNMDKVDFSSVENLPPAVGTEIIMGIQKAIQNNREILDAEAPAPRPELRKTKSSKKTKVSKKTTS